MAAQDSPSISWRRPDHAVTCAVHAGIGSANESPMNEGEDCHEQRESGFPARLIVYVLYGKEVAIPVMFFLSLGDPAAAMVGRRMPGPRIFGKSPLGTAAFIGVSAGAVAVLITANGIDNHWAIWAGAGVAGVVELASIPPDDNLAIPLLAGTAMFLLGV